MTLFDFVKNVSICLTLFELRSYAKILCLLFSSFVFLLKKNHKSLVFFLNFNTFYALFLCKALPPEMKDTINFSALSEYILRSESSSRSRKIEWVTKKFENSNYGNFSCFYFKILLILFLMLLGCFRVWYVKSNVARVTCQEWYM